MKNGIIAGAFDVIHPGYIEMFEKASNFCDNLTIALHIDPTIERPEKLKPILNYYERKKMLLSIKYINNIVSYTTEQELFNIMKYGKYDIRILGEDYKNKYATGQEFNKNIVYIDRSHGWSTTKYKKLIAESLNGENK